MGNTFDAHRLVHLGREHGRQEQMLERLFRAFFGEGQAISAADRLGRRSRLRRADPLGPRTGPSQPAYR
jgi:DSBA-like thioredoxin domain